MNRRDALKRMASLVVVAPLALPAADGGASIPRPGAMHEGVGYCDRCDWDVFPLGRRIDGNHYAVRFWDNPDKYLRDVAEDWAPDVFSRFNVDLNGIRIREVLEVYLGEHGWVIASETVSVGWRENRCPRCVIGSMYCVRFGRVERFPTRGVA